MSPQGLLALASLVLIGLGAAVAATACSGPRVNGVPAEHAGQFQASALHAGRVSLNSRRWIGLALATGGLALLLVGAIVLMVLWVLFGLVA